MQIANRIILTLALFLVLGAVFFTSENSKVRVEHVTFCDVGQGDGFVIFARGGAEVVFDSGLGTKAADCLGRYMPMWDRNVELMFLTHPQRDHMEGQIEILKRYQVSNLVWTGALGQGALFDEWQKLTKAEGARIWEAARGDKIEVGDLEFEVLWPTKSFIDLWKKAPGDDLNETSLVVRMTRGRTCFYFTGDIPFEKLAPVGDKPCQVLKVAHHGSKTGTSGEVVDRIKPQIAVIQVGRDNSYGHPKKEVLDMLLKGGAQVLRNDLQGDITLDFEGDKFKIKSEK